jgi:hypothetical protein
MHEHLVNPDVIAAAARATGLAPASLTVEQRLPMAHQGNHLYDVWSVYHHTIAKEFLSSLELGAIE